MSDPSSQPESEETKSSPSLEDAAVNTTSEYPPFCASRLKDKGGLYFGEFLPRQLFFKKSSSDQALLMEKEQVPEKDFSSTFYVDLSDSTELNFLGLGLIGSVDEQEIQIFSFYKQVASEEDPFYEKISCESSPKTKGLGSVMKLNDHTIVIACGLGSQSVNLYELTFDFSVEKGVAPSCKKNFLKSIQATEKISALQFSKDCRSVLAYGGLSNRLFKYENLFSSTENEFVELMNREELLSALGNVENLKEQLTTRNDAFFKT